MKKLLKKVTAIFMAAVISASALIIPSTTASAAGVFDGAKKMEALEFYSHTFRGTSTDPDDPDDIYYKITVKNDSNIVFRYENSPQGIVGILYNSNAEEVIKYDFNGCFRLNSDDKILKKGTYYLKISQASMYGYGDLTVKDLYYTLIPVEKPIFTLKATIKKGTKLQLGAITENYDGKVKWVSTKKSVATVSSKGLVTAKKTGNTTIRAQFDNGEYIQIKVYVKTKV